MKEFTGMNRANLAQTLEDNSLLLLFAGEAPKKTADEAYKYTPNRNFYYLTGIAESSVVLALYKHQGTVKESLFIKRRDEVLVKWVGETISPEEATAVSGITDIRFLDTLEAFLHNLLAKEDVVRVYFDLEKDNFQAPDTPGVAFAKSLAAKYPQIQVANCYNGISRLRVRKSAREVEEIKKAITITGEGIAHLMQNAKAGMKEYQLEAFFDFILKSRGVKDFAFTTICASGHNGTVLHYVANDAEVKEGDLVLLDLGAQHGYYSADISRTFPVSGKFSERQKTFYNIVLKAHDEVIAMVKPGVPYARINELVLEIYARELKALGLIEKDEEVRKYYYHNTSHHLGLDTHDVGRRDGLLEEGMVITVEPGLYIEEESIGIRLEDDVLITADGAVNLSVEIPITVEDVEAFLAKR